jgi:hypothetical protein
MLIKRQHEKKNHKKKRRKRERGRRNSTIEMETEKKVI